LGLRNRDVCIATLFWNLLVVAKHEHNMINFEF
jgi:hypothetical protein